MQFLLALFILRTWFGYNLFKFLSDLISSYLGFSEAGYEFLFGKIRWEGDGRGKGVVMGGRGL